jgi:hypothetical protein
MVIVGFVSDAWEAGERFHESKSARSDDLRTRNLEFVPICSMAPENPAATWISLTGGLRNV